MLPLFLFLYFTFSFCNCTTIKDYCIPNKNESHDLDKRKIRSLSNMNQSHIEHEIYDTPLGQTLLPFEDSRKGQDQIVYNPLQIKKRSKNIQATNKNEEDEAAKQKHLTQKLFKLFKKLDLGVNSDLLTELNQLRQKFNISEASSKKAAKYAAANKTRFKLPIPTYADNNGRKSRYTVSVVIGNVSTRPSFVLEFDEDSTTEIEYVIDETESDITDANYDDNTEEAYDSDVEFRQAKDSAKSKTASKSKSTVKSPDYAEITKSKPKTATGSTKKGKPTAASKTSKTPAKKTTKSGNSPNAKTKATKATKNTKGTKGCTTEETSTKGVKKPKGTTEIVTKPHNKTKGTTKKPKKNTKTKTTESTDTVTYLETTELIEPIEEDDDVVTISRIRGIWIGGRCRCNFLIRSRGCKINESLGFSLCIINLLLCLNYVM